jgi:hypothetical protein
MQIANDHHAIDHLTGALHIGVRPHHLPLLAGLGNVQDSEGTYAVAIVDGDVWEEWGESVPGVNVAGVKPGDYGPVFHVVIGVTGRAHAYAVLEMIFEQSDILPVPMRYGDYQKGIIASLTLMETWSEEVFSVKAGPADGASLEA